MKFLVFSVLFLSISLFVTNIYTSFHFQKEDINRQKYKNLPVGKEEKPKNVTILSFVDEITSKYPHTNLRLDGNKLEIKSEHLYEKKWQEFISKIEQYALSYKIHLIVDSCQFSTKSKKLQSFCVLSLLQRKN